MLKIVSIIKNKCLFSDDFAMNISSSLGILNDYHNPRFNHVHMDVVSVSPSSAPSTSYVTFEQDMTSMKPYKCPKCTKHFKYRSNLSRHFNFECQTVPKFLCKRCNKRFTQKTSLVRHSLVCWNKETLLAQRLNHLV